MQYKQRVFWSKEEEEILLDAINTSGKRVNIDILKALNPIINEKTNKHIANKIASLKNKAEKYNPRTKWTPEQECALLEMISSGVRPVYKELVSKELFLDKTEVSLKNKIYNLKKNLSLKK